MDSPCIKQTVCKVLKIFQYGKYLVAYVLNIKKVRHLDYIEITTSVIVPWGMEFFFNTNIQFQNVPSLFQLVSGLQHR